MKLLSGCDKLSRRSASRLRKNIFGTRNRKVATSYTMPESILEFMRNKEGISVID